MLDVAEDTVQEMASSKEGDEEISHGCMLVMHDYCLPQRITDILQQSGIRLHRSLF
jgi:hypothetical protein